MACYTAKPLATESDDEKRIWKAVKESKQLQDEKKRSATAKQKGKGGCSPGIYQMESVQPPFLLWQENPLLHTRCTPHAFAVLNRDILPGTANQQLSPAGSMGADKQAPNSLPSDGHSNMYFKAKDTDCRLVSLDGDLDKLEQNSVVKVKGRLPKNIAFWQSIGASQCLVNVL